MLVTSMNNGRFSMRGMGDDLSDLIDASGFQAPDYTDYSDQGVDTTTTDIGYSGGIYDARDAQAAGTAVATVDNTVYDARDAWAAGTATAPDPVVYGGASSGDSGLSLDSLINGGISIYNAVTNGRTQTLPNGSHVYSLDPTAGGTRMPMNTSTGRTAARSGGFGADMASLALRPMVIAGVVGFGLLLFAGRRKG